MCSRSAFVLNALLVHDTRSYPAHKSQPLISPHTSTFLTHWHCVSLPQKTKPLSLLRSANPTTNTHKRMNVEVPVEDVPLTKKIPVWDRRDMVANPVVDINNVEEYLEMMATSKGKVIVLKFYAPWCRSCRALEPKYKRLAREYDNILFAQINFEDQKEFSYRLGVKTLPQFHFYQNEAGKVEDFQSGPTRFEVLVRTKVREYSGESCLVDESNYSIQH